MTVHQASSFKGDQDELGKGFRTYFGPQSPVQMNSRAGQKLFCLALHFLNYTFGLGLLEIENYGDSRWKRGKALRGKRQRDKGRKYAKQGVTHVSTGRTPTSKSLVHLQAGRKPCLFIALPFHISAAHSFYVAVPQRNSSTL
jgi:hypothetical protein